MTVKTHTPFIIDFPSQHRQSCRDHRYIRFFQTFLQIQFMQSWFRWTSKLQNKFNGNNFPSTKDTNKFIHFVVIWSYIFVSNRPIISFTIKIFTFEVQWSKTERYPSPVIGPSTYHAGTEPVKLSPVLVGVWFSLQLPSSIGHVKIAEVPGWRTGTASWGLIRPFELSLCLRIGRIKIRSRF